MGKTPLCTDAAEPVAGGTTADKYVSRQHHGVAHRAEPRRAASSPRRGPQADGTAAWPRRRATAYHVVYHTAPPNSSSPLRASSLLSSLRPFCPSRSCSLALSLLLLDLVSSTYFFFFLSSLLPIPSFRPFFFRSPSHPSDPSIFVSFFFGIDGSLSLSLYLLLFSATGYSFYLFHPPAAEGSVPRLYTFEYYGNVDALRGRGIVLPRFGLSGHSTGSPARSRGKKERAESAAAGEGPSAPNGELTRMWEREKDEKRGRGRPSSSLVHIPTKYPFRRIYIVGGMRLLSAAASIISPNEDAHRHPRARIQKRVIICHSVGARAIFGCRVPPPRRHAAF